MIRLLSRRALLVTAALGAAVLTACTSPTAPNNDDETVDRSGVYGGSGTKLCSGVYGGSGTC